MKVSGLTPLKRSEGGPCGSLRIFNCAMWVKVVLKVFVFPDLVVKKRPFSRSQEFFFNAFEPF